jgi:NAD(P)-dependent dehydrogenase (short-subunit alcohol dehydrogenase family)
VNDDYVVVTGAAGALGSALTRRLADAGYGIVAIDVAAQIPQQDRFALTLAGVDLTDVASVTAAFGRIAEHCGRLCGLVNLAGSFRWESVANGDVATWDDLYAVNVRTAVIASRAALALLKVKGGAIVNVGAVAAANPGIGMGAYAASKSGVSSLTLSLARSSAACWTSADVYGRLWMAPRAGFEVERKFLSAQGMRTLN